MTSPLQTPPASDRPESEPLVWLCGAGLAVAVLMIAGLMGLIAREGLRMFWPDRVALITLEPGSPARIGDSPTLAGRIVERRHNVKRGVEEWHLFIGNKDTYGAMFRQVDASDVVKIEYPGDLLVVERTAFGRAVLHPLALDTPATGRIRADEPGFWPALTGALAAGGRPGVLEYRLATGHTGAQPLAEVLDYHRPNAMGPLDRTLFYLRGVWAFLSEPPREANTEGGIFPAIFGTFVMTLLMSVAVMPFGVLAAIHLREYARPGPGAQALRIAVNNLAGVPSIVYGVFGLGFFVYFVGGGIDQLFFADRLPAATFGTGGILWASLTLALLTVPVVIVATEEALAAVPLGVREASLACGASKWQTIQRVVLPASAPGILTGLILAMARGAGEVAPLMLVGVVKLAPALPLDGEFPFFHLDRKFMHLGFHIYDLGFQSPDSEAARPMVFATSLLLILLVVVLNLGAILIRNRLRKRYRGAQF